MNASKFKICVKCTSRLRLATSRENPFHTSDKHMTHYIHIEERACFDLHSEFIQQ